MIRQGVGKGVGYEPHGGKRGDLRQSPGITGESVQIHTGHTKEAKLFSCLHYRPLPRFDQSISGGRREPEGNSSDLTAPTANLSQAPGSPVSPSPPIPTALSFSFSIQKTKRGAFLYGSLTFLLGC